MAETIEQKRARIRKLTTAQRQAILKNFKLTASQQQALKGMAADAADRQVKEWQDRYIFNNLPAASSPTSTKTPATTPPPAATVPPDWEKAAMELYGGYYSIVQSVPELKDLVLKATQEGWDPAKFQYQLRQTSWWKTTTDSARQWDMAAQIDPASAEQAVVARIADLQNSALSNFNVQLDETQLRKLATDSLRGGWNEQTISNAIGLVASQTEMGFGQLASGYIGQNIRQTANQYGLRLSDDVFNQWTTDIATGKATSQTFQQYALETAKTLFPGISTQLDSGQTFQQIVDPFRSSASQLLNISADSIDFLDPKWTKAISNVDQSGQQRMMSFSEWADYLRNERSFGYEYTPDAQEKAFRVANQLANLFGRV